MFDQERDRSQKAAFHEFVKDAAFPCVGARSAAAKDQISIFEAGSIECPRHDASIVQAIQAFAQQTPGEQMFVSFVVVFNDAESKGEAWFESQLWARLQAFHDIDATDFGWDETVSSDPNSTDFSMSLGGKAFYVVGLHPAASRAGRRYQRPALVLNLHNQFENLRASGAYQKFRNTILERDRKLNGSDNPMLAVHGDAPEAIQYSGRHITGEWKCPFHAHTALRGNT